MNRSFTYEMLLHELGVQKADRLSYIDFLLQFKGSLSRADLTSFFGIKEASASQVISEYRELRPNNVEYDRRQGKNVILYSTFSPLIEISAENGLGMLANGFNKTKLSEMPLIEYERIDPTELGEQLSDIRRRFPQIQVLGGCCGTDMRHMKQIVSASRTP